MPNVSDFGMVERRQNFSFALTYTARTDKGDDFTRSNLRPCQEMHCVGMILAYFRHESRMWATDEPAEVGRGEVTWTENALS